MSRHKHTPCFPDFHEEDDRVFATYTCTRCGKVKTIRANRNQFTGGFYSEAPRGWRRNGDFQTAREIRTGIQMIPAMEHLAGTYRDLHKLGIDATGETVAESIETVITEVRRAAA